jgi:hypothetical protein
MTTDEAARAALIDLARLTEEWATDRDMGATVYYCRACLAHADRMTAEGRIVGRHVPGCKLRAALDLAEALGA